MKWREGKYGWCIPSVKPSILKSLEFIGQHGGRHSERSLLTLLFQTFPQMLFRIILGTVGFRNVDRHMNSRLLAERFTGFLRSVCSDLRWNKEACLHCLVKSRRSDHGRRCGNEPRSVTSGERRKKKWWWGMWDNLRNNALTCRRARRLVGRLELNKPDARRTGKQAFKESLRRDDWILSVKYYQFYCVVGVSWNEFTCADCAITAIDHLLKKRDVNSQAISPTMFVEDRSLLADVKTTLNAAGHGTTISNRPSESNKKAWMNPSNQHNLSKLLTWNRSAINSSPRFYDVKVTALASRVLKP